MENWARVGANVALTGGAVFDYISGELHRAPRWMTAHGRGWGERETGRQGNEARGRQGGAHKGRGRGNGGRESVYVCFRGCDAV